MTQKRLDDPEASRWAWAAEEKLAHSTQKLVWPGCGTATKTKVAAAFTPVPGLV